MGAELCVSHMAMSSAVCPLLAVKAAISEVNAAIDSGDMERLYAALEAGDAKFSGVDRDNLKWYMDVLTKAKKDKLESSGCSELEHNEIQDILTIANSVAEHTRLGRSLGGGAGVRRWGWSQEVGLVSGGGAGSRRWGWSQEVGLVSGVG